MSLLEYLGLEMFIYGAKALPTEVRFTLVEEDVVIHYGGRRVTSQWNRNEGAVAEPAMTQSTMWRFKIRNLTRGMMMGFSGKADATEPYCGGSVCGWAGEGQAFNPMESEQPLWTGFEEGEEVAMKLDMEASSLLMHVPRLEETFQIDLPAQPAWFIYVNLCGAGDSVD